MTGSSFPFPDPARPEPGVREAHRLLMIGDRLSFAFQFEQSNKRAGFQTVVFGLVSAGGTSSKPVVISALDIELRQGWELRTSGLWSEQVREDGYVHWSYGLEAFALAIDEPDELVRRGHGHRVPLGWELDFVSDEPPDFGSSPDEGSFTQLGTVDGLVLTGSGEHPINGPARRSYWRGGPPAHSHVGELCDEHHSRPGSVILPTMAGPWTVASPNLGG